MGDVVVVESANIVEIHSISHLHQRDIFDFLEVAE